MILIKETIEKFGYNPKDLKIGSEKLIIVQCDCCKKNRISCKANGYQRKTKTYSDKYICKPCWSTNMLKSQPGLHKKMMKGRLQYLKNRRNNLWKIEETKVLNIDTVFMLLYRGGVEKGKPGLFIFNNKSNYRRNKTKYNKTQDITRIPAEKAPSFLKPLGFTYYPNSTKDLRVGIMDWVLKQKISYRFSILMKRVNTVNHTRVTSKTLTICLNDKCDYSKLLNSLGFEHRLAKNGYKVITKGSFYINNRWINIG